jgi:uncharacterized membrane protein
MTTAKPPQTLADAAGPGDPDLPAGSERGHHPVVLAHAERRAADAQLRVADAVTRFAGSMPFVYLHAVVFAGWMLFAEGSPWPTLTLVVSLEAIFLSTFVMIGQNRQAAFQQEKADHDFVRQEQDLAANTAMTRQIRTLAETIHAQMVRMPTADGTAPGATAAPDGGPDTAGSGA